MFATQGIAKRPRYNSRWRDPISNKAVDGLHLRDDLWASKIKWRNSPWSLLPDLVQTLRQLRAAAISSRRGGLPNGGTNY
jgi:hypothetical protein